ncbi:MAG: ACT domain-containing protein [Gammaproteobacteria bacterium]
MRARLRRGVRQCVERRVGAGAGGEERPAACNEDDGGCNLGEASMMRLGGNFAVMLMVQSRDGARALGNLLEPVADSLGLHMHVDAIEGRLHEHAIPDVRVTVFGADRVGIVAQVTGALAEAGFDILDLDSDVAGSADQPVYVMHIEGRAREGIEAVRSALAAVSREDIEVEVQPIETMIG